MKLSKEKKEIDLVVVNRELTREEHQKISEYIKNQKALKRNRYKENIEKKAKKILS